MKRQDLHPSSQEQKIEEKETVKRMKCGVVCGTLPRRYGGLVSPAVSSNQMRI